MFLGLGYAYSNQKLWMSRKLSFSNEKDGGTSFAKIVINSMTSISRLSIDLGGA